MHTDIKPLQNELRVMLKEFINCCEQNGLCYYLFYGTLLGAVRHEGFIPWDDDIDLLMPRRDIERFVSLYGQYYSESAHLDGYNCSKYDSFAPNIRICSDKMYLCQRRNGKDEYINAFLSIWIIDGLPDNKVKCKYHLKRVFRKYAFLRLSRSSIQGVRDIAHRSLKERMIIKLNSLLQFGRIISPRYAAKKFNETLKKYPLEQGECCFIGWNPKGKRVFRTEWFQSSIQAKFDGLLCNIPCGYDQILKLEYGDYMKLPPINRQQPSHSLKYVII